MTDGPRQRGSVASGGDAAAGSEKDAGGGGVALKKEIGLVSACGIIVGECTLVILMLRHCHFDTGNPKCKSFGGSGICMSVCMRLHACVLAWCLFLSHLLACNLVY